VEKHDWKALAESLAEVGEDLRAGRVPDDPDALVKYGRNLKKLRALARALGVPPTIEAIARDPRTGPSLIAANVARLWPDAPAADVAAAKRQAEDALIRHQTALSTASTPAATAAAEADLKSDLKDVIDEVERSNGPPTVKVEFEVPVEVIPEEPEVESELEPEPADPTNADPTNADEASSATPTTTADQVLGASGLATPTRRVYEGSRTDLTRRVHSAWKTDRGYDADATASLEAHAVRWIEDYAAELASTKSEVVAALNAGLGQGTAPGGVSKADVAALQGRLMDLQAAVERRLPAGSRTPDAPVPTFFLERSASVTLKSLR